MKNATRFRSHIIFSNGTAEETSEKQNFCIASDNENGNPNWSLSTYAKWLWLLCHWTSIQKTTVAQNYSSYQTNKLIPLRWKLASCGWSPRYEQMVRERGKEGEGEKKKRKNHRESHCTGNYVKTIANTNLFSWCDRLAFVILHIKFHFCS